MESSQKMNVKFIHCYKIYKYEKSYSYLKSGKIQSPKM